MNYKSINHDFITSWKNSIFLYTSKEKKEKNMERNMLKATYSSLSRLLKEFQTKEGFEIAKPIFEKLGLPLNRKVKPADIFAKVPASSFYIDKYGNRRVPIREGTWSLEKLEKLLS